MDGSNTSSTAAGSSSNKVQWQLIVKVTGAAATTNGEYLRRLYYAHKDQTSEGSASTFAITPSSLINSLSKWSANDDDVLMADINAQSASNFFKQRHVLQFSKHFRTESLACLSKFNLVDLHCRALLIEQLNKLLGNDIVIHADTMSTVPESIGSLLKQAANYVFVDAKDAILAKNIAASVVSSGSGLSAQLNLDNMKALHSIARGDKEPSKSECCFVQAFRQLNSRDPVLFKHVFNGDRVMQIKFENESGIDAGGVFREGVSRIVEDLFSENFNLLILCPNGQHSVHVNTEKYIPNPSHTSALAMDMFRFVGKLIGMSIRVKLCLPISFPPVVWKLLLDADVGAEDLMAIDMITYKYLEAIRNCESDGITDEAMFAAKYGSLLRFVYNRSDGTECELFPGGQSVAVRFADRVTYCDKVLAARLEELRVPVRAIAQGLDEVVQLKWLRLFSWSQLEIVVAGSPHFDFDLWKSKTESGSLSAKTVALFWKVLESLSPAEQAGFVRFAWGRSRLPSAKDFKTKMQLSSAGRAKLPVSHTCFFSVEMPEYETEEEMRHGLLTAIHFGVGGILLG